MICFSNLDSTDLTVRNKSIDISPTATYFGQDQDAFNDTNEFDLEQTFSGQLAEVAFWDRAIGLQELQRLASCQDSIDSLANDDHKPINGLIDGKDFIKSNVSID